MTETKPKKKKTAKKGSLSTVILACLPLILITASLILYRTAVSKGLQSAFDSFKSSETEAATTAHDTIYNFLKKEAEERHHVSNRASITIGTLKETANLEVFRVPDTEFVIENKDDNKYGITSWLKVKGTGIFTVNLNLSEFLIDDARDIVTVRIPRLELEYDLGANDGNMELLYKKQDLHLPTFVNETKAAKEITDRMIEEGRQMLRDEISNTPEYYFAAQEATQEVLTSVLKGLNPDKQDLTVIVEFVD